MRRLLVTAIAVMVSCTIFDASSSGVHAAMKSNSLNKLFSSVNAIKAHSFHVPLLADFEESGFEHWSYGSGAVVTNDYITLTPAYPEGHGHVWNSFPSQLSSFAAHFALRVTQRPTAAGGNLPSSEIRDSGMGFWAIKEPVRHSDHLPFYGVPENFEGFGIVITQAGELHIVAGDGKESAQQLFDASIAKCQLPVSEFGLDVVVNVDGSEVNVGTALQGHDPVGCAKAVLGAGLPTHYYFGFTALTTPSCHVGFQISGFIVQATHGATDAPLNEKSADDAALFDHELDKREREFWREKADDNDPRRQHSEEDDKARQQEVHDSARLHRQNARSDYHEGQNQAEDANQRISKGSDNGDDWGE